MVKNVFVLTYPDLNVILLCLDILLNIDWRLLKDGMSRKHLKTERISQRYTTDWKELATVM